MTNEDNIYQSVPEHYVFCYNDDCELAGNCLRRLAARHTRPRTATLQIVNPLCNNGKTCRYYKPKKVMKMAYGMVHTYDKVLAADIASIRKTITKHFGNGSYYVRRNGKYRITPDEQQYINNVFRAHGYPDGAVFDRYADELEW